MTNNEIKKALEENGYPKVTTKNYPLLYKAIIENTKFLEGIDGKLGMSLRVHCILNDVTSIPICKNCGESLVKMSSSHKDDYGYFTFSDYCSRKCATSDKEVREKIKKTSLERYGTENPIQCEYVREKTKKTNLERYGVEHVLQCKSISNKQKETYNKNRDDESFLKGIIEKTKKTNLERYGVENPMHNEKVKEKIKKTNLERYGVEYFSQTEEYDDKIKAKNMELYGVEYYMQTEEYKRKTKKTCQQKYGTDFFVQSDEFKNKYKKHFNKLYGVDNFSQVGFGESSLKILKNKELMTSLYEDIKYVKVLADMLGVDKKTVSAYLKEHGVAVSLHHSRSSYEVELVDFIKSFYKGELIENDSEVLGGKHLDIYLPDKRFAIEFNGIHWHSTKFKDKKFHQQKTLSCKDRGIRLFHIWEDQWNNKKDIVKNMIRNMIGENDCHKINARECEVKKISQKECNVFLEAHHLQGKVNSSIRMGLFFEGVLVSVMSLKKEKDGQYNLTRFASSCLIRGGFSKLLKAFTKQYPDFTEIVTFANLDYSYGELYRNNGFEQVHITKPNMWYSKDDKRYNRQKFMKYKLPNILENFDASLTESENMANHRFGQIYDAGMVKFVYTKS